MKLRIKHVQGVGYFPQVNMGLLGLWKWKTIKPGWTRKLVIIDEDNESFPTSEREAVEACLDFDYYYNNRQAMRPVYRYI